MLREYIKLQDVFTENVIKSIDNFLRIDYFGLSFESIGILSMLITDVLEIKGLPPLGDEDDLKDMKENLITAKIEAIAANTVANTKMMPKWITIKLGFQQYRYLFFAEVNKYYYYMLAEGNLKFHKEVLNNITNFLLEVSQDPFEGNLKRFSKVKSQIGTYLREFNAQFEI